MTRPVFFAGFSLTLSAALSYYVNSSFLAGIVGKDRLGLVYAAASLLALILILAAPRLARRFNLLRPSRALGLVAAGGWLGLSFINWPVPQLFLFILTYAAIVNLGLWLDLYLESYSRDKETGRIRGRYLTTINTAILLAPLVSGSILGYSSNFRFIYLLSFIATLPLLYQLFFKLEERRLPTADLTLREKLTDQNLRRIIKLDFLLNLFYFVMVIYLPLHLHEALGFPWERIGLVFTVMLVPFVLIQYPLGWLADKRWGEKEILTAGLAITGLATLPIAFTDSQAWLVWAGLLFATRLGASAWEAMKESYLFKHVNVGDIGVIGLARLMVPGSYLVGSIASFLLLKIIPLPHLFTALGLLTLGGILISRRLVDTR